MKQARQHGGKRTEEEDDDEKFVSCLPRRDVERERERGVPLQLILVDYCTRCALGFQSGIS